MAMTAKILNNSQYLLPTPAKVKLGKEKENPPKLTTLGGKFYHKPLRFYCSTDGLERRG